MTLKYMLDTNICIFTIKNKPAGMRPLFNDAEGLMCISSITLAELQFGVSKTPPEYQAKNRKTVADFVSRLEVLPFEEKAAQHYGDIRFALAGKVIGNNDFLIAAHARSQGLILVTNNTREFSRVPGLLLEDWTQK